MIARTHNTNGHASGKTPIDIIDRLVELDRTYVERRQEREAASTYTAGTCDRMNPMLMGIDPLGTDADYHYRTERDYFLMVERGRAAVRNHPLVEQGVNRLIANMRIGDYTLDVNSGDPAVDADQKAFWYDWCGDSKQCDYEQQRTFSRSMTGFEFGQDSAVTGQTGFRAELAEIAAAADLNECLAVGMAAVFGDSLRAA